MPLPNPKVLDGFITLYERLRQKDNKPMSMAGKAYNAVVNTATAMIGGNTDQQIMTICTGMKNKFQDKVTVEKWLEVAHDLAKVAADAQNAKSPFFIRLGLTEPDSKLCNTLHAIRTYIIQQIITDIDLYSEYHSIVTKELQTLDKLKEKIIATREEHNDVTELSVEIANKLLKLAHLGHRPSIHEAIDRKLLEDLPRLHDSTSNMPTAFYDNYYLMFYNEQFQFNITGESFDEWESKQIISPVKPSFARLSASPSAMGAFSPVNSDARSRSSSSEDTSDIPPPPPPRLGGTSHSASQGDPT